MGQDDPCPYPITMTAKKRKLIFRVYEDFEKDQIFNPITGTRQTFHPIQAPDLSNDTTRQHNIGNHISDSTVTGFMNDFFGLALPTANP